MTQRPIVPFDTAAPAAPARGAADAGATAVRLARHPRRDALAAFGRVLLGLSCATGVRAQTAAPSAAGAVENATSYPSRPIRLIVPFPPSGATDIAARVVAQKLQDAWGQPVVVENRPGGGSNIGSDAVAKAPPDGYTLLLGTIANATNMAIYRVMPYDTLRDFAPITQIMSSPSVLAVGPAVPVRNLQELIALARSRPGELTYTSSGAGGSPHLAATMLEQRAGIRLVHVPYKGAAPAMADLIGGQVTMGFKTALSAVPMMQTGRIRAIAVADAKRLALLPDVPTMAEAGLPDFEVSSWNGLLAPARTPGPIVDKLHREVVRILALPDVHEKFAAQAATPIGSTPAQFRDYIRAEIDKWGRVAKTSGLTLD